MNNLIAIAEVVPAVDLNLPRGIVLAAMYDKTTDALKMMSDLLDVLEDIPENLKKLIKDMIAEAKEAVTPKLPSEIQLPKEGETWQQFLERRLRETGLFK